MNYVEATWSFFASALGKVEYCHDCGFLGSYLYKKDLKSYLHKDLKNCGDGSSVIIFFSSRRVER